MPGWRRTAVPMVRPPRSFRIRQSEAPRLAGGSAPLPRRSQMPGIRLHPNYTDTAWAILPLQLFLKMAAARALVVQIALCMEDERTQHPLLRIRRSTWLRWPSASSRADASARDSELLPAAGVDELREWRPPAGFTSISPWSRESVGGPPGESGVTRARPVRLSFPTLLYGSARLKMKESGLTDGSKTPLYGENALRLR